MPPTILVIEEHEGAGVEQLLKDRYDMELELAKSLMQKEFDDTLAAEKVNQLCPKTIAL